MKNIDTNEKITMDRKYYNALSKTYDLYMDYFLDISEIVLDKNISDTEKIYKIRILSKEKQSEIIDSDENSILEKYWSMKPTQE